MKLRYNNQPVATLGWCSNEAIHHPYDLRQMKMCGDHPDSASRLPARSSQALLNSQDCQTVWLLTDQGCTQDTQAQMIVPLSAREDTQKKLSLLLSDSVVRLVMQPGLPEAWQTKMSDTNHLGLPDSLAISRSGYASQYLALRRTSGFQQMKLRKIIQAGLTKSLATSKSSHASVTSSGSEHSLLFSKIMNPAPTTTRL